MQKNKHMDIRNFKIGPADNGTRLDKYIATQLGEGYSRMLVKKLMEQGSVAVNGKQVKHHYEVKEADEVSIEIPPEEASEITPEKIPLNIIYEDASIIVINKKRGMVVHPGCGNKSGTLVNAVLFHCGKLPDTDNEFRPGIVHRLDKETSGVIIVAKTAKAHRSLSKQFQKRAVKKIYLALVKGCIQLDNGIIEAPLGRHHTDRKKMDVDEIDGKSATTVYHVKKRFERSTLVELDLKTGRTHQIRVHLKYLGYPVIGDAIYGYNKDPRQTLALHAMTLGVTHPVTSKYVEFNAPVPRDMKKIIDAEEAAQGESPSDVKRAKLRTRPRRVK